MSDPIDPARVGIQLDRAEEAGLIETDVAARKLTARVKKTTRAMRAEDFASAHNDRLRPASVCVVAGGDRGPFTVVIDRLQEHQVEGVIAALLAATGRVRNKATEV